MIFRSHRGRNLVVSLHKLAEEFVQAILENGIHPYLKVLLVGTNPASLVYTANKKKYCEGIV